MTPEEIEAERQRFEALWIPTVLGFAVEPTYIAGRGYLLLPMQRAWEAWLAAIASERDRRKQEQDAADALLAMQGWPEMRHMRENGE